MFDLTGALLFGLEVECNNVKYDTLKLINVFIHSESCACPKVYINPRVQFHFESDLGIIIEVQVSNHFYAVCRA